MDNNLLTRREREKRNANWDMRERKRVVLETLAWAATQRTVGRNTPSACLAEEKRKLRVYQDTGRMRGTDGVH